MFRRYTEYIRARGYHFQYLLSLLLGFVKVVIIGTILLCSPTAVPLNKLRWRSVGPAPRSLSHGPQALQRQRIQGKYVKAFTKSTDCVKSPVATITVAFPLLSGDWETYGRQQKHFVVCDISDGRQVAWRLDPKYSTRKFLFVYLAYAPFCGIFLVKNAATRPKKENRALLKMYPPSTSYFWSGQVQQKV